MELPFYMKFNIDYYDENLEREILKLPDGLLARYIRLTEIMQLSGPNLGMPHVRPMGDGLYELRLKGKEGIGRVLYCNVVKNTITMLHIFIKKTEKTPKQDLSRARKRLQEIESKERAKTKRGR